MPNVDGLYATKVLKAINPNIKIIALTAFILDSEKQKAMNAGCDVFLTKPLKKEDLYVTLGNVFS